MTRSRDIPKYSFIFWKFCKEKLKRAVQKQRTGTQIGWNGGSVLLPGFLNKKSVNKIIIGN